MIGLRELWAAVTGVLVLAASFFGSSEQPAAVETSLLADGLLATAQGEAHLSTAGAALVGLSPAPATDAPLELTRRTVQMAVAPDPPGPAVLRFGPQVLTAPAGSIVTVEGYTGRVTSVANGRETLATLQGTATRVHIAEPAGPHLVLPLPAELRLTSAGTAIQTDQAGLIRDLTIWQAQGIRADGIPLPSIHQEAPISVGNAVGIVVVLDTSGTTIVATLDLWILGGTGDGGAPGHQFRLGYREDTEAPGPGGAPLAEFGWNPALPNTLQPVLFSDRSLDDDLIVAWDWSFGDGGSDAAQFPVHRYTRAGTYTVHLTVRDSLGQIGTAEHDITIANRPPSVDLQVEAAPLAWRSVPVTVTAQDVDGTLQELVLRIESGSAVEIIQAAGATIGGTPEARVLTWALGTATAAVAPEVNFTADGPATVTASTLDDEGAAASATRNILVLDPPPLVELQIVDPPTVSGAPASARAVASDNGPVSSYSWSLDGQALTDTDSDPSTITFTPAYPGSSVLSVQVEDEAGNQAIATQEIEVGNRGPQLGAIELGRDPPNPGSAVSLTVSATDPDQRPTDPDPEVVWLVDGIGAGEGSSILRTFPTGGTYQVEARATDALGATASVTREVVVNTLPAVTVLASPTESFIGGVPTGTLITLSTDVSDPDPGSGFTYAWRVRNGLVTIATGTDSTLAFTPLDDAFLVAEASVTDGYGGTGRNTVNLNILNRAPTVTITAASLVHEGSNLTILGSGADPDGTVERVAIVVDGTEVANATGASAEASLVQPQPGAHTILVRATDDDGDSGVETAAFTVNAVPRVNVAVTATSLYVGDIITLTATVTDPDGVPGAPSWFWDGASLSQTGSSIQVTLDATGEHTATARSTDDLGGVGTGSALIDVQLRPLELTATHLTTPAVRGQSVSFRADVNPGYNPQLQWTFDDGATLVSTSGQVIDKIFSTSGRHSYRVETITGGIQGTFNGFVRVVEPDAVTLTILSYLPDSAASPLQGGVASVRTDVVLSEASLILEMAPAAWAGNELQAVIPALAWAEGDLVRVDMDTGSGATRVTESATHILTAGATTVRVDWARFPLRVTWVSLPATITLIPPTTSAEATIQVEWTDGTPMRDAVTLSHFVRLGGAGGSYQEYGGVRLITLDDTGRATFFVDPPVPGAVTPGGTTTGVWIPGRYRLTAALAPMPTLGGSGEFDTNVM